MCPQSRPRPPKPSRARHKLRCVYGQQQPLSQRFNLGPSPHRTMTEPKRLTSHRHINTPAQAGDLAPVAPDKVCDVPQRRVARQNGVISRVKQAPDTRHATIRATQYTEQTSLVPLSPRRTCPPSTRDNVCELRAGALTPSNPTTRTEWSIVLRGDKPGPMPRMETLADKQETTKPHRNPAAGTKNTPTRFWNIQVRGGCGQRKQAKPRLGGDCRYAEPQMVLCMKHRLSPTQSHEAGV